MSIFSLNMPHLTSTVVLPTFDVSSLLHANSRTLRFASYHFKAAKVKTMALVSLCWLSTEASFYIYGRPVADINVIAII